MKKYRKKPVVIEAVQFNPDGLLPGPSHRKELPDGVVVVKHSPNADNYGYEGFEFGIDTLEGMMKVQRGDWIIKGVKGEYYPCKPDIFEATYEEVK